MSLEITQPSRAQVGKFDILTWNKKAAGTANHDGSTVFADTVSETAPSTTDELTERVGAGMYRYVFTGVRQNRLGKTRLHTPQLF